MLTLVVKLTEEWDEEKERFVGEKIDLHLEHSLVSLSKWESHFEKPFLGDGEKTDEETMAYIGFMITDDDFPPGVLSKFGDAHITAVNDYLNKKQSATWFSQTPSRSNSSEQITSELIYYWMTAYSIPFECESWPLSRLFTLIRICDEKNKPPKKMSRTEALAERKRLNAERRAQFNSHG